MPTRDKILQTENVATLVKPEELKKVGEDVVERFKKDLDSRSGWMEKQKQAMLLASQVKEPKNYPWANASSVKYPLITMAAVQFHARASMSLLSASRPVKAKAKGEDPEGSKATRATLVSKHMSHQVLHEMKHWMDENDRLFLILAIIGLAFKKTYRCPIRDQNVSELVTPQQLVISYYAKDFEKARKTEVYTLNKNEILTRVKKGVFVKLDPDEDLVARQDQDFAAEHSARDEILGLENPADPNDPTTPYRVLDQYAEWDFDGDGYAEPYCVTVEQSSSKVLRIRKLYDEEGMFLNEKGEVYKINQEPTFTRFILIPETDSPIYAFGLGTLLNPLNDSVNTILNQLIDAGHLSNLQSGFLARGIRLPRGAGSTRFSPGEWKVVPTTGDDLRKGVFPLPTKEPSNVLFQLLGLLIQAGEEISSVADLMKGENPGQNQPYSTTAAVLEQGMQVFTSIYKRLFRSFREEYVNLFNLNSKFLPVADVVNILDPDSPEEIEISKYLYRTEDMDVLPEADPDVMSQTQRQLKAESLMEKVVAGLPINPAEVTKRLLEAEGHEDIPKLLEFEPQPDPEAEYKMRELEMKNEIEWAKLLIQLFQVEDEAMKDAAQAIAHLARADSMESQAETQRMKVILDALKKSQELESKEVIEELKADVQLETAEKQAQVARSKASNVNSTS